MLKMIIRRGTIKYREPINVNLTIWVLIDVLTYVEKGVKNANEKRPPKKLQELIFKDYGVDFPSLFDIAIDISQYSNVETLGTDYLKF
jgi:hypothetical protein